MLKVGIIGCGKIADDHASQIQRIKGCEIVGVCDNEPLMARQLYERFPIRAHFSDLAEFLGDAKPDVVHITTPPENHFSIAKVCLESGCHVYVEKPLALCAEDAKQLIALANQRSLKITVGHDDQFSPTTQRMRALVQQGFLGSQPVHMESYYCYPLGRSAYASAFLGDKKHWVRRLPGKLLHNIIDHGIARIAEFWPDESLHVTAHGFISPLLKSMGENEIIDELRVIISDGERTTAYFTFSSQMRPALHQFRIYGSKNGLILDQDQQTLIKLQGVRLKSYLEAFVTPSIYAKANLAASAKNVMSFLSRDLHPKSGMKFLIESFYSSIVEGTPLPIQYAEILLTARIMDAIFDQLENNSPRLHAHEQLSLRAN